MATSAIGYKGDIQSTVDVSAWLDLIAGYDTTVGDMNEWVPSLVAGTDRTVSVTPGTGMCHGLYMASDTSATVSLAPAPSGGSRWDMVGWVGNWNTKAAPKLVAIQGGSTAALPKLTEDIGTALGYIPIALVQVTDGQQMPTQIIDLRTYRSPNLAASTLLAIRNPREGQQVTLPDGTLYVMRNNSWKQVYRQTPYWIGSTSTYADGMSLEYGQFLFPVWGRIQGNTALQVPGFNVTVPAGVWTVNAYANAYSPNCVLEARIFLNAVPKGSLSAGQPKTPDFITPAGADRTIVLTKTTNLCVGFHNPEPSTPTHVMLAYNRLSLIQVGDL